MADLSDEEERTLTSILLYCLKELVEQEFKEFKWYLSDKVLKDFPPIPKGEVKSLDKMDAVDVMVKAYRTEGALKISLSILRKMTQHDLAQRLERDLQKCSLLPTPTGEDSEHKGIPPPSAVLTSHVSEIPPPSAVLTSHGSEIPPPSAVLNWKFPEPSLIRTPPVARVLGQEKDLRIVLVGKTGVGKSASGNTILGRRAFIAQLCASSVTLGCEKLRGAVNGRNVAVVDTPGLFDTELSNDEIVQEIAKCISLSSPGPHVFLVVIRLGRFTQEEQDTVKIFLMTFGPESAKHTMVLFTYGDRLSKRTIQDFLRHSRALQAFIHQCHDRYHVFNNEDMENHSQVPELLQKIDEMVEENGGGCYTNKMYKEAEAAIQAKIQKGKSREEAEKDNGFLKKVFIVTGRTVVAKVIAAVGAAAGGADELAITVSDKCTIQ